MDIFQWITIHQYSHGWCMNIAIYWWYFSIFGRTHFAKVVTFQETGGMRRETNSDWGNMSIQTCKTLNMHGKQEKVLWRQAKCGVSWFRDQQKIGHINQINLSFTRCSVKIHGLYHPFLIMFDGLYMYNIVYPSNQSSNHRAGALMLGLSQQCRHVSPAIYAGRWPRDQRRRTRRRWIIPGWCNCWWSMYDWLVVTGTWLDYFSTMLKIIIPIDELIFFRGVEITNQMEYFATKLGHWWGFYTFLCRWIIDIMVNIYQHHGSSGVE